MTLLPDITRRECLRYLSGTLIYPGQVFTGTLMHKKLPPVVRQLPRDKYAREEVAITIDDCWSPDSVEKMLDVAEEKKVALTLFPVGLVLVNEKHRKQLERAAEMGCYFGNHTYGHRRLAELSSEEVKEEVRSGYQALRDNLPAKQLLPILRPPCGSYSQDVADALADLAEVKAVVLWSFESQGARYTGGVGGQNDIEQQLQRQIERMGSRSLILLHAIANDADIFTWLIRFLQESGYKPRDLKRLAVEWEDPEWVEARP